MTFFNKLLFKELKAYSVILCALGALLLNGCGFQLRGDYLLPPQLQTIHLSSVDKFGELTRVVKQHLLNNQVNVVTKYSQGLPEMRILKDTLDRRTLSVFPNGQVAEYELIYTVSYQLILASKDTQTFKFEINRDYQDDPDKALAKSRELSLMLSEMRKEVADKILRSMASIQI